MNMARECKDPLQTDEKHVKLNKSLRQSTNKLMNSTSITHLFNLEAKRREMAYI